MVEKSTIQKFIEGSQRNQSKVKEIMTDWNLDPQTAIRFGIGYFDPMDDDQELMELYDQLVMEQMGEKESPLVDEPKLVIPEGKDFFFFRSTSLMEREDGMTVKAIEYPKVKDRKHIFNERFLYEDDGGIKGTVFICFTIQDVLAYLGIGRKAVFIDNGDSGKHIRKIAEDLKNRTTKNGFIYVLSDFPEEKERVPGHIRDYTSTLTPLLTEAGITIIPSLFQTDGYRANRSVFELRLMDPIRFEQLVKKDEADLCSKLMEDREEYSRKSSGYRIDEFKEYIDRQAKRKVVKTGFQHLDEILDGGLYPGLYSVGAVSSLGKTAFCLQIADQVAEKGNDVLFFTLEQKTFELMARSISRLTYMFGTYDREWRSNRDILNRSDRWDDEQREAVNKAMETYRKMVQDRIFFIHDITDIKQLTKAEQDAREDDRIGVLDIQTAINNHLSNRTGSRPVVIIDYLQILKMDPKKNEKQNLDETVFILRKLAGQFEIPIIAISSFNRQSYNAPVEMSSFKESGGIEYTSDVIIGIQPRDFKTTNGQDKDAKNNKEVMMETKESEDKQLKVRILKNRNGKLGTQPFVFHSMFSAFYEDGDPEDPKVKEENDQANGLDWTPTIKKGQ